MSTEVETYAKSLKSWGKPYRIRLGERSVVIRDFQEDTTRTDYYFSCDRPDEHSPEEHTVIWIAKNRGVPGQKDPDFEVHAVLTDGKDIELSLKTQNYSPMRLFRITQRTGQ